MSNDMAVCDGNEARARRSRPPVRLPEMFGSRARFRFVSTQFRPRRPLPLSILLSALLAGLAAPPAHAQNDAPIFTWPGELQVSTSTLTIREGESLTYSLRLSEQPLADGWWVRVHVDGVVYIDGVLEEKTQLGAVGWLAVRSVGQLRSNPMAGGEVHGTPGRRRRG